MQYRGELEAGVTYVEDMVTPSDGFWRGAPLFASPDKVIQWQERFVQMAVRLKSDIGSSQTLVGNITGWEVGYEDSTIGPMVDAATPGMLFGGGVRIFVGNIDNRQAYIQEGQEGAISFRKRIPVWLEFVVVPEAAAGAESFAVGWTDDSGEDFIEDTSSWTPDEVAIRMPTREDVIEAMEDLPSRLRLILGLRFGFFDEMPRTLEEVGHELGVTRERVRQLERQALDRLRGSKKLPTLEESGSSR